ncbi:hypothetical protein Tco_1144549 [Tanacetum coccineum]
MERGDHTILKRSRIPLVQGSWNSSGGALSSPGNVKIRLNKNTHSFSQTGLRHLLQGVIQYAYIVMTISTSSNLYYRTYDNIILPGVVTNMLPVVMTISTVVAIIEDYSLTTGTLICTLLTPDILEKATRKRIHVHNDGIDMHACRSTLTRTGVEFSPHDLTIHHSSHDIKRGVKVNVGLSTCKFPICKWFDGHPSILMGFRRNIEGIGPHMRIISINITSSFSSFVQTSSALGDMGTNPSDSKSELNLRTFSVMNEFDGSGGVGELGWFFGLSLSLIPHSLLFCRGNHFVA